MGLYRIGMAQTPAIGAAERAGIRYVVCEFEHDPAADSYGLEAAEKLGADPRRVFKTLVVSLDGALAVACVPVLGGLLEPLGFQPAQQARRFVDACRSQVRVFDARLGAYYVHVFRKPH